VRVSITTQLNSTQLNSTSSGVELCHYKRALSVVPGPVEYTCKVSLTSGQRSRSLSVLKCRHRKDGRTDGRTSDRFSRSLISKMPMLNLDACNVQYPREVNSAQGHLMPPVACIMDLPPGESMLVHEWTRPHGHVPAYAPVLYRNGLTNHHTFFSIIDSPIIPDF